MSNQNLDNLRHSCAHLLAKAVLELYPGAHNAIGPAIDNGFYQDFDMGEHTISESDLPKIEAKMREILPTWTHFEFNEVSLNEARKLFKKNPYKIELLEEFATDGKKLLTNNPGDFLDLCKMGHVDNPSKEMQHFKLLSVAGAYWRGSEKNKMLTRIYGTCWPSKEELDHHLNFLEETKKRDHRKLGKDLDLFSISQLTGSGLVLWHPKLSITRDIVESFWKAEHYKRNYQLVYTPHIASMDMFVKSRHYNKYINSMFPAMLHQNIEGESKSDYTSDEQLKPMNCPNHIQIYQFKQHSYKELPIRIGELGTVYRYERAGVLHGMTRVRGFTQDDSHIFCTPDQVIAEVRGVIQLTRYIYDLFGFKEFQAYLSTRPEKYLGTLEMWDFAQDSLKRAMELEGVDYKIDEGEGVFYGPKIDSKIKDSLGREWQLGTIQFDFNQPDRAETTEADIDEFWNMKTFKDKFKTREALSKYLKQVGRGFDVNFINDKGEDQRVVMVHRTILGSMERFFGILIEHYSGAFPTWLSPVQSVIIPISDKHLAYAKTIEAELKESGIRVELNDKNEPLNARIRDSEMQKIPYILVVGDKEVEATSVSVRSRAQKQSVTKSVSEFISDISQEISTRALTTTTSNS
ncbi:MAG: threonine--tRNA ligase [Patescibacteria group bacterium]